MVIVHLVNYFYDKVLHPFAKVSKQNHFFSPPTRSGENRFVYLSSKEEKWKGES